MMELVQSKGASMFVYPKKKEKKNRAGERFGALEHLER